MFYKINLKHIMTHFYYLRKIITMHLQTAVSYNNFNSFSLISHCNRINFIEAKNYCEISNMV